MSGCTGSLTYTLLTHSHYSSYLLHPRNTLFPEVLFHSMSPHPLQQHCCVGRTVSCSDSGENQDSPAAHLLWGHRRRFPVARITPLLPCCSVPTGPPASHLFLLQIQVQCNIASIPSTHDPRERMIPSQFSQFSRADSKECYFCWGSEAEPWQPRETTFGHPSLVSNYSNK